MPRRSKKSIAALAREASKTLIVQSKQGDHQNATEMNKSDEDSNSTYLHTLNIPYVSKINGNFHQGDKQFSSRSRGSQCSCIALALLCKIDFIFENLTPDLLDSSLRAGDFLYKDVAQELDENDELAPDGYLDNYQLPTSVNIDDINYDIEYMYEDIQYGSFDETEAQGNLKTLDTALNSAFTMSQKNILIMGGSMMALYMDTETNKVLFFDSHSRDKSGFPCPDGSSFAITFQNVNNLVIFLQKLSDKLNLRPRHFGIQPLICTQQSTFSIQPDSIEVQQVIEPKSERSRFQNWYSNLDMPRKEALKRRTKRQSQEQYQNPEKAKRKCQQARQASKDAYQNPEKAKRKRQHVKRCIPKSGKG